ncbi:hypothetical protein FJV46_11465 [Arthrobacter agilis]|uniref:hypothetical protein n=1 Tax=Arthrobacter agilis TaxID=37921 RepID=UPI000F6CCD3A|nr:hypothetical protein [Arthrobacter agilis]TPV23381.1 hypothetical protein FJV46_11465 [Arthrobacter agilis]VDR31756.1 Uncharacterised protein [Arthrobacter agilis]
MGEQVGGTLGGPERATPASVRPSASATGRTGRTGRVDPNDAQEPDEAAVPAAAGAGGGGASSGDDRVDRILDVLDTLDDDAIDAHADLYQDVHDRLARELNPGQDARRAGDHGAA